jgi:effector-binding domain-containing protein
LIYKGPYEGVGIAYNTLLGWVEANGYQMAGPNREVYLNEPGKVSPDEYITEIQIPIEKIEKNKS